MSRRHLAPLRGWETNFDQGAATSVVDSGSIRIAPRTDWNSEWLWWAARSDRMGGKTPHFLIAKASRVTAPAANENLAVWSTALDTDTWYAFDNQSVGASDIEFYNNAPFPNGRIYISYLPLYPFARVGRVFREWIKDARVTLKYAGQATPRAGAEGRRAPGLPFYGLLVTNASGYTKNNMVLAAGTHPSETRGPYQLEGAMNWLLGGSPEAEFLLDWFNVYVYPCLNPQGVNGGYFRSQPEDATKDPNRYYDTPGTLEQIDALVAAWTANHADIEVGVSFHAYADDSTTIGFAVDATEALHAAFAAKMTALEATYTINTFNTAGTDFKLWLDSYSAALSVDQEAGSHTSHTVAKIKTYGEETLKSITALHADGKFTNGPGIGSRDFNGATDRIDWASAGNLTGHALSISFWVNCDALNAAANQYVLCIHDASDASFGIIVNISHATNKYIGFLVNATTDLQQSSAANAIVLDTWQQFIITWDGVITTASSVHIYRGGTELTYSVTTNGATETTHSGSWSLGGRKTDDNRNHDGMIAQVGVWNRVLTAGEIANLAAGYAPDLAAASDLLFYFKGNTSSLVAVPPTSTGTADGTTSVTGVGNGPSIVYG